MSPGLLLWLVATTAAPDDLTSQLAAIAARHGVPGLGAFTSAGDVVREGAWGVRKLGDATPVTTSDRWHLGSDTKAMTATLAALLVQEGKLAWTTPVTVALADWTDLDPGFAKVTLEMLLTHRAGLDHDVHDDIWKKMWRPKAPEFERQNAVHAFLQRPPTGKAGDFVYSNAGYMVAGVVLEKVTGQSWETLMRERLFAPLGMSSCGFGAPAAPGKLDAPLGHRADGAQLTPVEPGRGSDNPPGLGPAGTVHCALRDWHAFVQAHVRGERGVATKLGLSRASFEKLHTAVGADHYGLGWGVSGHPRWPTARALTHDGSNTMFYASVLAVPTEDIVILVAMNRGGDEARLAAAEVVNLLAGKP